MSLKRTKKIDDLFERCESPYLATNYIAIKARRLKDSCYNVISDSQAVEWAISGVPPTDLDEAIKKRISKDQGISEEDKLSNILDSIEEENIRIAVLNSYKLSKRSHQIMFDYNGIKDKGTRTRIRILTKMTLLP